MKTANPRSLFAAFLVLVSLHCFSAGLPDLTPIKLELPGTVISSPRPEVVVSWAVTNQGSLGANYWNDTFYLSTNTTFTWEAWYVDAIGAPWPLLSGDYYEQTRILSLPVYTSGTYHLFVTADGGNSIPESVESNNLISASFEFVCTPPDLAPVSLVVPRELTTNANPWLTIAWAVTNQGIGSAVRPWTGSIVMSTDTNLDLSDQWIASTYVNEVLPAGGSIWRTNDVQLPIHQSGTYYLFLRAGWDDPLLEPNTANNLFMATVQARIVEPDLLPIYLSIVNITNAPANPVVSIVWGVTNQGPGPASLPSGWGDYVRLSLDPVLDPADSYLISNWENGLVPPGSAYWRTNSTTIPISTNGIYYLILTVDTHGQLQEASDSNNQLVLPITFSVSHPDLAPLVANVPATITGAPNPILKLAWGVTNQGTGPAAVYQSDRVLFSSRNTLDNTARELTYGTRWAPLQSGESVWRTNDVQLPVMESGDYYLLIVAEAGGTEIDADPGNNLLAFPINIQIIPPDLAPSSFQFSSNYTGSPNPSLKMTWRVENRGSGSTGGGNSWVDSVFLSSDAILNEADREIYSTRENGPVASGAGYWRTNTVQIPTLDSGDFYLFFVTDSRSELVESDNNNNRLMAPIHLGIKKPDILPLALNMPLSITGAPNPTLSIVWGVTNQGAGDAYPSWGDGVWFSKDSNRGDNDTLVLDRMNWSSILPAGQSLSYTNEVRIPCTSNGTYYLIFEANKDRQLAESDLANNLMAIPFEFHTVFPDLAPVSFQVPSNIIAPPNPTFLVSWCITNMGLGEARPLNWWASWYDRLYLSGDTVLDPQDIPLNYNNNWGASGILPPGGSYWSTNVQAQVPVQESGDYYLILATDWADAVQEADETNNTMVASFRYELRRSDLATLLVDVPKKVVGPPNPRMNLVWAVTNQGPIEAAAPYSWKDGVFFSRDPFYDWLDQSLEVDYLSTPLPPGTSLWHTNSVRPPVLESGTYYLAFKADSDNSIPESNENNNTVIVPIDFTVVKPDLVPSQLDIPTVLSVPPRPSFQLKWAVTNQGLGEADWDWTERVTVSTNPIPSSADATIGNAYDLAPVPAGGTAWRTVAAQTEIVQSGTYYLTVRLNEYKSLIETDYANNLLTVPVTIQILPPDLAPLTARVPAELTGPPNPRLTLSWGVTNQGPGLAKGSWVDAVYFSRDAVYDPADQQLAYTWRFELPVGTSHWTSSGVRLPCIESGDYFLIFRVNPDGYLYESDLLNNVAAVPIRIRIERSDLVVSVDSLPNQVTCSPNPRIPLSWSVKNNGSGLAESSWSRLDAVYISTNNILDESALAVESTYVSNPLAAGATNRYQLSPRLPVADSGRYFLIFAADVQNNILEADESNNQVAVPVDFEVLRPDLAPTLLLVSAEVTGPPNLPIMLIYGVTNSGPGNVEGASWSDALYISTNSVFDESATLVQTFSRWQNVLSSDTYWSTNSVHLPVNFSGKRYLFLKIDNYVALFESDTGNNQIATSLNLNILPPDLVPIALTATNSVLSPPNPNVQLVWGVTNQGVGPAVGSWPDEIFLSKRAVLDDSAMRVGSEWQYSTVSPGASYWSSQTLSLPVSESGDYFLFLRVNSQSQLFESNFINNVVSVPIRLDIGFPDLAPIALQVTNIVLGTQNPSVRITWGITNLSDVPALGYWTWADAVFLSTDATLDNSDASVLDSTDEGSITAQSSYWRQQWVTLPVAQSGKYYLILSTDTRNRLTEANEDNNTMAVPITVRIDPPDLAPIAMIVPNVVTGSPNTSIQLVVGVTNQGVGDAATDWWDSVFLSDDSTLDIDHDYRLLYLNSANRGSVSPGGVYWSTNNFQMSAAVLPSEPLQATNLFLVLAVNDGGQLRESTLANNTMAVPFQFVLEPAPDLALLDFKVLEVAAGSPEPIATISWGVTNQGAGTADFWMDGLFIATNSVLNPDEFYRGVDSWYGPTPLRPGESYWRTNSVLLPATESGPRYLVLVTDSGKQTRDAILTNNVLALPITLHVDLPDLEVLSLVVPPVITGSCEPLVSIAWAVTNRGPGSAQGRQWADSLYLSDTPDYRPVWPFDSVFTGLTSEANSYWKTNAFRLPLQQSGVYYLTLKTAQYSYLTESNPDNNALTVPITYNRVDPDLMTTALIAPQTVIGSPRPETTVAWCVTNLSPVAFDHTWRQEFYFSRSGLRDGSEEPIGSFETAGLPGLGSYWGTNTVRLPLTESLDGYLMVVNSFVSFCDTVFSDKVLLKPISVTVRPPDIAVAAFLAPSIVKGVPYPEVSVITCLTNQGTGPVFGNWSDQLYLSATPFRDAYSVTAMYWERTDSIPPGRSLWLTNNLHLPVIDSGDYYLIYRADADYSIWESSEINNEAVVPIRLDLSLPPDLMIRSFSAPRLVTGPAYPSIEVSWVIENQGLGPAMAPWNDQLFLEGTGMSPKFLGTFRQTNSLPVGDAYKRTQPIVLPITASGTYALSLTVNDSQSQPGIPGYPVGKTIWFNFVLTEEPPPALVAEGYQADGFHLSVRGMSSKTYRLMASSDLVHWERVLDLLCTNVPARFVDPSASINMQRFYQVVAGFVPEPLRLAFTTEGSPANAVSLLLDGPPAPAYRIEISDDLQSWIVLTNLTSATTPIQFRDAAPVEGQRFYRAVRSSN